jgi:hypothetical protein
MDHFYLKKAEPLDDPNACQWDLGLQVYVNGLLLFEDDYCLDIESFISAVGERQGSFSMVGGCGTPGCCAVGATLYANSFGCTMTSNGAVFQLEMKDIIEAIQLIITEIEQLEHKLLRDCFVPKLDKCRRKLWQLNEQSGIR